MHIKQKFVFYALTDTKVRKKSHEFVYRPMCKYNHTQSLMLNTVVKETNKKSKKENLPNKH